MDPPPSPVTALVAIASAAAAPAPTTDCSCAQHRKTGMEEEAVATAAGGRRCHRSWGEGSAAAARWKVVAAAITMREKEGIRAGEN
uniref:Uncharacterized protein n=1 Tax=Oryza meridionalis TaxID=40149 RepID=A0A0E0EW80_9ORYZ